MRVCAQCLTVRRCALREVLVAEQVRGEGAVTSGPTK